MPQTHEKLYLSPLDTCSNNPVVNVALHHSYLLTGSMRERPKVLLEMGELTKSAVVIHEEDLT